MKTPMTKGSFEYIKRRKRRQGLIAALFFGIAMGIFVLGLVLNKMEKTNVFTVFAVLMVLPATKYLISFIILIPYTSVSKERYEEVKAACPDGIDVWTDVVFSSAERVMMMDFMMMDQGHVICYSEKKDKVKVMEQYLRDGLSQREIKYQVEVYDDFGRFKKRLAKLTTPDHQAESYDNAEKYLRSLMV